MTRLSGIIVKYRKHRRIRWMYKLMKWARVNVNTLRECLGAVDIVHRYISESQYDIEQYSTRERIFVISEIFICRHITSLSESPMPQYCLCQ